MELLTLVAIATLSLGVPTVAVPPLSEVISDHVSEVAEVLLPDTSPKGAEEKRLLGGIPDPGCLLKTPGGNRNHQSRYGGSGTARGLGPVSPLLIGPKATSPTRRRGDGD